MPQYHCIEFLHKDDCGAMLNAQVVMTLNMFKDNLNHHILLDIIF